MPRRIRTSRSLGAARAASCLGSTTRSCPVMRSSASSPKRGRAAAIFPSDGPRAFGLGDIELGIKYRFVQEGKHRPMVGTFVMFEMPSGNAGKGLGVGKTWYKVPVWVQKSFGPWTTYGGGGVTVVPQTGYRNYPFAGWLVQRDIGKRWTLGSEVFYHGPEGIATAQTRPASPLLTRSRSSNTGTSSPPQ